jgi:hypothetical protein
VLLQLAQKGLSAGEHSEHTIEDPVFLTEVSSSTESQNVWEYTEAGEEGAVRSGFLNYMHTQ